MSKLLSVLLLIVGLGLIAQLSSWAIVGGLLAVRTSVRSGLAFAGAMSAARLVQGILGGGALLALVEGILRELKLNRATSYLLILAGAALLTATLVFMLTGWSPIGRQKSRPEEVRQPVSPWRRSLTAFGLTLASPRQWLFTAAVVSAIGSLGPGPLPAFGLFALFLALSLWITLGLVAIRVTLPERYEYVIETAEGWKDDHGERIAEYVLLAAAVAMIAIGVAAL